MVFSSTAVYQPSVPLRLKRQLALQKSAANPLPSTVKARDCNKDKRQDPTRLAKGNDTNPTGSPTVTSPIQPTDASTGDTIPALGTEVCAGKKLTNGAQVREGSCNNVIMGQIPDVDHMPACYFVQPVNNAEIEANTSFNVVIKTTNIETGFFGKTLTEYYSTPQRVNPATGLVQGHFHTVIQLLENDTFPDIRDFKFFKGADFAANSEGLTTIAVTGGLDVGEYRAACMLGSQGHQPVLYAIAKRGPGDDCFRFKVVPKGSARGSPAVSVPANPSATSAPAPSGTPSPGTGGNICGSGFGSVGGPLPLVSTVGNAFHVDSVGKIFKTAYSACVDACNRQAQLCKSATRKTTGKSGVCSAQVQDCYGIISHLRA